MEKILNISAGIFIFTVQVLAGLSILAVWDYLSDDVAFKALSSGGLISVVLLVILSGAKFFDRSVDVSLLDQPNPSFAPVRRMAVVTLIISSVLLAFVGLLSIWGVLSNDVIFQTLASIGIIAFAAVVVIAAALSREKNPNIQMPKISVGRVVFALVFFWLFSSLFVGLLMNNT